jgi:hypothetical protein
VPCDWDELSFAESHGGRHTTHWADHKNKNWTEAVENSEMDREGLDFLNEYLDSKSWLEALGKE